jgi:hypothetical protein
MKLLHYSTASMYIDYIKVMIYLIKNDVINFQCNNTHFDWSDQFSKKERQVYHLLVMR